MHDDRPPWMPFYWEEFFNDPKVTLLNHCQRGMYLALMRYAWRWSNPPCSLPNLYAEEKEQRSEAEYELRKVLGCPSFYGLDEEEDDFRLIGRVLDCWDLRDDGRLYQKRLEFEFNKAMFATKRRVEAAESTNEKRWGSVSDRLANRSATGDRSLRACNSLSSSNKVFIKRKEGGVGGEKKKGNGKEVPFSMSVFAEWDIFREALKEWEEERARFYFDLFTEKEALHPTKYKYARWDLAARAWDRRSPNEWRKEANKEGMTFEEIRQEYERTKGVANK